MIKPTVGRVVWFTPSSITASGNFAPGAPLAAIVAHVHSDRLVNLAVFDANGVTHSRTSVPLLQDDEAVPVNGYYAEWMPFQKGQAAKQESQVPAQYTSTFQGALAALKDGRRVARAGWNGKGMFAYMVPAASYPVQTGAAKAHFGEGSLVPYNAYFALKGVDETVSTWVPSVTDCLADDWQIVDLQTL
ncbi:hypothetical protein OKW38_002241 [Paraburkholderia sp. MM5496-R1]|uniref:DUF2829 domain-containing protein n=1 Tax=Paraburkholderia sp. MM5496-R1 TaxID=2991065 RepID=UPI003D24A4D6